MALRKIVEIYCFEFWKAQFSCPVVTPLGGTYPAPLFRMWRIEKKHKSCSPFSRWQACEGVDFVIISRPQCCDRIARKVLA